MSAPADAFIFVGITVLAIVWIYIVGRIDSKKEVKRSVHGATNFARLRAQLALSSEVIKKG